MRNSSSIPIASARIVETLKSSPSDTSIYLQKNQPYYIVAPAYNDKSAGIRLLHRFCSLLNQLGCEAYVESPKVTGELWTPKLNREVMAAHYLAGKKPIVVYPEVVSGHPMNLGIPVRYALYYPGKHGGPETFLEDLVFCYRHAFYPEGIKLQPPALNIDLFYPPKNDEQRELTLVYYNRYSGPVQIFSKDQKEISSKNLVPYEQTGDLYRRAKIMYAYEESAAVGEARICGCPVVLVPNEQRLPERKDDYFAYGSSGLAWGLDDDEVQHAIKTSHLAYDEYMNVISGWRDEVCNFIELTQRKVEKVALDVCWPEDLVDTLPGVERTDEQKAVRADRIKHNRTKKQYGQWRKKTTLREMDAQEYAEHWVSVGGGRDITVLIENLDGDDSKLADTIDSICGGLGLPAHILIVRQNLDGRDWFDDKSVVWATPQALKSKKFFESNTSIWIAIVKAGDQVEPNALVEWSMHSRSFPEVKLFYSDEDVRLPDGYGFPFFKPGVNIEMLKCINYIGTSVFVSACDWYKAGAPVRSADIYRWALQLSSADRANLYRIDGVMYHSLSNDIVDLENDEFSAVTSFLSDEGQKGKVTPLNRWGTWLTSYADNTKISQAVTLVIPSGLQVGYLACLLEGVKLQGTGYLAQIIVISHQDNRSEVEAAIDIDLGVNIELMTYADTEYNHARVLNQAVQAAKSSFVLIADDDTEPLHSTWLQELLGMCSQPDVGCVSPRLMASRGQNSKVTGGPIVLGINGSYAAYNGEDGYVYETGPYSRLQVSQDVSVVAGHFFMFKHEDWLRVNGFDQDQYRFKHVVADFCLRLKELGRRNVWTPLSNILHHGGKTLEVLFADPHKKLKFIDVELDEQEKFMSQWSRILANDPFYNRHLSLIKPFDIESDIVVDWRPDRGTRRRVLALPVESGAGQYRVVEPLNALQNAGLVRTSVILPMANRAQRIIQPLELLRAKPDVFYLQYSMSDLQVVHIADYRKILPSVKIVQAVDDLMGNVPEKHPSRVVQLREGHRRMMQSIIASDSMIVTTQPLHDHYSKYVGKISIVPNALDDLWFTLTPKVNPPTNRLRIGWVGAQQHQGDLQMICEVVRHFSDKIDWVFMGLCIDEIKPFVKEIHPFVSIAEYPLKMADLSLDVAIAPLENNHFNQCKSNLRLLEYGAMSWPVVCSDVYPYRTNEPPVIRCRSSEEWIAAIDRLINDADLRRSMGVSLNNWVKSQYLLKDILPLWVEAFDK